MRQCGNRPEGLEIGNAWDLRSAQQPETNWIVGQVASIPTGSPRYVSHSTLEQDSCGDLLTDLAVKWFVHSPQDDPAWGQGKPTSAGCTLSILADEGEFEYTFTAGGAAFSLILDRPGDYALWGPGMEHTWKPLKRSTILTVRWRPLPSGAMPPPGCPLHPDSPGR
jgi:hypothetical protein